MQIRSAQNVGKVWISRKKSSWPHLGQSQVHFSMGRTNPKHAKILAILLGGPMGPIHQVWVQMGRSGGDLRVILPGQRRENIASLKKVV